MRAILTFTKRVQAENFAKDWSRFNKTGHTIGPGKENVEVSIYGITEDSKKWIDNYVSNINKKSN